MEAVGQHCSDVELAAMLSEVRSQHVQSSRINLQVHASVSHSGIRHPSASLCQPAQSCSLALGLNLQPVQPALASNSLSSRLTTCAECWRVECSRRPSAAAACCRLSFNRLDSRLLLLLLPVAQPCDLQEP